MCCLPSALIPQEEEKAFVDVQFVTQVHEAAAKSELVQAVGSVRRDGGRELALAAIPLRPLYRDEITQLESLGNSCVDWSRVRVAEGFDWRKVRHSSFHGDVILGRFGGSVMLAEGVELPAGIDRATLVHCVIGNDVLIRDVKLLANYVIGEGAVLLDCGTVTCEGGTKFGNGSVLPLGIQSGGREVAIYAEIDLKTAAAAACSRSEPGLLDQYSKAVTEYAAQVFSRRGIVERRAVIRSTPTVRNTYVGRHARIDGATLVADTTLLSNADEPAQIESGACVTASVLQWGSRVSTMAIVDQSVLLEHSHAEQHGKVSASILGPNTGVAAGEATSCLLGPFVSSHHQALLIATLWPEGKGNVAYGANVGSNHTSKAPDQEFRPGEGAFLGLGVSVKFPADFSRAPYTLVACGVTTQPQKLKFPFSLINLPSANYPGISRSYNEITPAWLLTDSLYTLKRNEGKHQARNKARRTQFDFRIFRPEIVDLMRDACRRLEKVRQVKEVYTERDLDGLGKNFMREACRQPAIAAYRFFIRYYALLNLKERVRWALNEGQGRAIDRLLATPSNHADWEHPRRILHEELGVSDVSVGLRELPAILERVARFVEDSKARDDERGRRIIDDYAEVHAEAGQDPIVRQTWDETRRLQREIDELVNRLECGRTSWEALVEPLPVVEELTGA
jgi:NDP-sugar pyrophosphorylase family protein